MKKYKLEKKYEGTYLEVLINEYNNFIDKPKFFGERAYNYMRSLRIEIAEVRKQIKRERESK